MDAGWLPDPINIGVARYWDGEDWTSWVAFGGRVEFDPTPLTRVRWQAADVEAGEFAEHLHAAETRGVIPHEVVERLVQDLRRQLDDRERTLVTASAPAATAARAATAAPATAPAPSDSTRGPMALRPITPVVAHPTTPGAPASTAPVSTASVPPRPEPAPVPVEPGVIARWWGRTRGAVASDLAVHGLAYLGVLLLFVGVFGLVAFSFGDVDPVVRELAEVLTPTACFVSAAYLSRRRAAVVAHSLEFVGGAVLPIVVIASVTDGAGVPPDLTGHAVPIVQGIGCLLVALAFVAVVRRRATSPLRFLVGPTAWLGLGLLSGALRATVATGRDVIRPAPFQLAVIVLAATATVAFLRRRSHRDPTAATGATAAIARGLHVAALPTTVVAIVAEIGLAAAAGWPVASGLLVAIGALAMIELQASTIDARWVAAGQAVVLTGGALRAVPGWDVAWVAVVTALASIALAEWTAHRRPSRIGAAAVCTTLAAAVAVASIDAPPMLAATGLATVWLLGRHARPAPVLPWDDRLGLTPGAMAALVGVAVVRLLELPVGLAAVGATVAVVAAVGRVVLTGRCRTLWRWWTPTAATVVAASTLAVPWSQDRWWIALTLASVAIAMAAADGDEAGRAWATTSLVLWAGACAAAALALTTDEVSVVLAAAGLAGVAAGTISTRRVLHHLAAIGHLVGAVAIGFAAEPGTAAAVAVTAWLLGWAALTAVTERTGLGRRACGPTYLDRCRDWLAPTLEARMAWFDQLPAATTAVLVPIATLLVVDATGAVRASSPWAGTIPAGTALAVAAATRLLRWRRTHRPVLAWVTTGTVVGAAAITATNDVPDGWTMLATVLLSMAALALLPAPRLRTTPWLLWFGVGASTVIGVHLAGAPRDDTDVTAAMWGAAVLLGALVWDRHRAGPVGDGPLVRTPAALAPAVLGLTALAIGGPVSMVDRTPVVPGIVLLVAGVTTLAVAWLLRLGAGSAAGWWFLVAGAAVELPEHVWQGTWWYVGATALLLAVAGGLHRVPGMPDRDGRDRWDTSTFIAAHGTGFVALAIAAVDADITPTFLAIAALCLVVSVVLRQPTWAVAGALLVLAAAFSEQQGWPALALAIDALVITVSGLRLHGLVRRIALGVGAVCALASWVEFVRWLDWSATTVLAVTVPIAAGASVVLAVVLRYGRGPTDALVVWAVSLVTAIAAADLLVVTPGVDPGVGWSLVALGAAAISISTAITAVRFGDELRWATAALAVAAGGAEGMALDLGAASTAGVATTFALGTGIAVLFARGARPASPWIPPTLAAAAAQQSIGLVGALAALPDRGGLIAVFLALAAEAAVVGAVTRTTTPIAISPLMACAGWITYASDALTGDPNWFTVPIGLALLTVSSGVRWVRHGRGHTTSARAMTDIAVLDVTGATMLVAAATVQSLLGELQHALVVLLAGIGLLVWAAIGRVRHRLAIGVGTVLLAVALLLVVPLVEAVPTMSGPGLWATVAVIGLGIIVLATTIEQSRSRIHRLGEAWRELTSGWE